MTQERQLSGICENEINMEFRAGYVSGIEGPEKTECGYYNRG